MDTGFNAGTFQAGLFVFPVPYVYSLVLQADGKVLVGGAFSGVAGQTRRCLARLNPDGTLDTGFNPGATHVDSSNTEVYSLAVQADGKILVGGVFGVIGGQNRSRIARLDPATGLADSFNPNADSTVLSIALQADGKILAGGSFTHVGGQTRNRVARLGQPIAKLPMMSAAPEAPAPEQPC